MAFTTVTTPNQAVPAYEPDTCLYQYKESFTVTSTSSGTLTNLRLTVGSAAASFIDLNEFVLVSGLENASLVPTNILEVVAIGADYIEVDFPYSASFVISEVRLFRAYDFIIETGIVGNVTQPARSTLTITITPDTEGIYNVDCRRAVITRFKFIAPEVGNTLAHIVGFRAYRSTDSKPDIRYGFKTNEGVGLGQAPLSFKNISGLITTYTFLSEPAYTVYEESAYSQAVDPGTHSFRYLEGAGKVASITFNDTLSETLTTLTPSSLPAGYSLQTINSGQTYTGITVNLEIASTAKITLVEDDGVNPAVTYELRFFIYDALATKDPCPDKAVLLVWWSPTGGWKQYAFDKVQTYNIEDNEAQEVDNGQERFVSSYEDQREAIDLISDVEGQTIINMLNTMYETTEVFIANLDSNNVISSYDRVYLKGGSRKLKTVNRYLPPNNRFQITIYRSAENQPLNQD